MSFALTSVVACIRFAEPDAVSDDVRESSISAVIRRVGALQA